jgi:hypothetical protein
MVRRGRCRGSGRRAGQPSDDSAVAEGKWVICEFSLLSRSSKQQAGK